MDESDFDRTKIPKHLKAKVSGWSRLSVAERLELVSELSEAEWARIGFVRDPNKPIDKTIRRLDRNGTWIANERAAAQPNISSRRKAPE